MNLTLANLPTLNRKIHIYSDLTWVSFARFEEWDYFCGYAYAIKQKDLFVANQFLKRRKIYDLVLSEINQDWQDAVLLQNSQIPTEIKHILRIAMLVRLIPSEGVVPVCIDTYSRSYSKLEGHHRLIALKLLKYDAFPAYLSGIVSELDFLCQLS